MQDCVMVFLVELSNGTTNTAVATTWAQSDLNVATRLIVFTLHIHNTPM